MKTNKGLCGKVLRAAWHMLCEIECIQVIELARGPYCRYWSCNFWPVYGPRSIDICCHVHAICDTISFASKTLVRYLTSILSEVLQVESLITLVHSNKP